MLGEVDERVERRQDLAAERLGGRLALLLLDQAGDVVRFVDDRLAPTVE
jgi:hypothetical protein